MTKFEELHWYRQDWDYCDHVASADATYIKIPHKFKKNYKVNYIPFLLPKLLFGWNRVNIIQGKPLEKILRPVILTNEL